MTAKPPPRFRGVYPAKHYPTGREVMGCASSRFSLHPHPLPVPLWGEDENRGGGEITAIGEEGGRESFSSVRL